MADVAFVYEDDGWVAARHVESGVASFGDTETDGLRELMDAFDSHFGNRNPIPQYNSELEVEPLPVETVTVHQQTT